MEPSSGQGRARNTRTRGAHPGGIGAERGCRRTSVRSHSLSTSLVAMSSAGLLPIGAQGSATRASAAVRAPMPARARASRSCAAVPACRRSMARNPPGVPAERKSSCLHATKCATSTVIARAPTSGKSEAAGSRSKARKSRTVLARGERRVASACKTSSKVLATLPTIGCSRSDSSAPRRGTSGAGGAKVATAGAK